MADEKNQNDAVQDLLARLRSQMNQLDEAFGLGSLTTPESAPSPSASSEEEACAPKTEETETVAEAEMATETEIESNPETKAEEEAETETETEADPCTFETEEMTKTAEEEASEMIDTAEKLPEQIDIFAALEEAASSLPEEEKDEGEAVVPPIVPLGDGDDTPVFVREDAPVHIRKSSIVAASSLEDEVKENTAESVVVTFVEQVPTEEESVQEAVAEEEQSSFFVPNATPDATPTVSASSPFSPERRFDPSRYDAMLAAYEKQKAENFTEPAEEETEPPKPELPKKPILMPLPEVPKPLPTFHVDVPMEEEEESTDVDLADAGVEEMEAETDTAKEELSAAAPQETKASQSPLEEVPTPPHHPRIIEADPSLRDTGRGARRGETSNRVFAAPSAYRVGEDRVREARRAAREEDEEDYMSELPEVIRGHLVGSPLGRPNRVQSVKAEASDDSAAASKKKRQKQTQFAEELLEKEERLHTAEGIRNYLKQEIYSARIRLVVVAVLSFILLFLENIPYVSVIPSDFVEVQTAGVLNALLLLGVLITAWPRLAVGWQGILLGRVLPESILLLEGVFAFLYAAVFGVLKYNIGYFSLVPALGISLLYCFRVIHLETLRRSFEKTVSAKDMLIMSPLSRKRAEAEIAALEAYGDPDSMRIYRIRKTVSVDGFVHRSNEVLEDERLNFAILLAMPCVGLVCFLIAFFTQGSLLFSFEALLFGCFVTAPIAMMCGAHKYPMHRTDVAAGEDSFIAGEATVREAAGISAVSFEDTVAAPASLVKISGMRVYCDDPTTVFKYLTVLYNHIGGPLCGRFSGMYSNKRVSMAALVELVGATKDGVSAVIDGAEVVVGNGQHMLAFGIYPAYDAADERALSLGKCGVLYVAINGMICMKFYVEHGISSDFVEDVRQLNQRNVAAILRTYDPNFNTKILSRSPMLRDLRVHTVSKKKEEHEDYSAECAEGGIATTASARKLLSLLLLCFRTHDVLRFGWVYKLVGCALGGGVAVLLSILGAYGFIPSVFPALYQLVLLGGFLLYAGLRIRLPDISKGK